jgi:hypothetical protein
MEGIVMHIEYLLIGLLGVCVGILGLGVQFIFEEIRDIKSIVEEISKKPGH